MSKTDSEAPFPIGGDKPLRMKTATFGAIILSAITVAVFLENIRRDVADQGATLLKVVTKQDLMSYKLDRLEWTISGRRGPAPEKPDASSTP